MESPDDYLGANEAYDAKLVKLPSADSRADLPRETAEALLRIVRMIAGLSRTGVLYLHARLQGMSGVEASKSLGFTKQAGHQAGKRAAGKYPELAAFFAAFEGARRRKKGARRRKSAETTPGEE